MSKPSNTSRNLYRIDDGPRHTQADGLSIRCPHCRQLGIFDPVDPSAFEYLVALTAPNGAKTAQRCLAAIRVCPNTSCKSIVLTIESHDEQPIVLPHSLLDFNTSELPAKLAQTLEEAVKCYSFGAYRASAMMVRRLLEELCQENNATGANLHERISALKSKLVLPKELFNAMFELKALGNDAAHVEARNYDYIGSDEAQDSVEIAKEILKAVYQLKGLVGRLQARKNSNKPQT